MPSSTSSFDLPPTGWRRAWGIALGLTLFGVGAWEIGLRSLGVQPAYQDSVDRWRKVRREAGAPGSVAVIGTSRALAALWPRELGERLGRPVHQLAVLGASPVPVLHDLADDESFRGTVLCGVNPRVFYGEALRDPPRTHPWVGGAAERTWADRISFLLSGPLEASLAMRRRGADLLTTLRSLARGYPSSALFQGFEADRTFRMHFERYPQKALAHHQASEAGRVASWPEIPQDRFAALIDELRGAVERIRARGGDVIFVRLPSSGPLLERERELYPREVFWEPLLKGLSARGVHFEDLPGPAPVCPDHTHLAARDVRAFLGKLGPLLAAALEPSGDQR